jgi:hypothetical protein
MTSGDIIDFKTPFEAYEHCEEELRAWHPRWQTALRAGDLTALRDLIDRYRHRVLAVFPKDAYRGSWAGALRNFAYRLGEFSEFEQPLQHMTEACALYEETLSDLAPDWNKSLKAPQLHNYAELLLRLTEVGGLDSLQRADELCQDAQAVWDGEKPRFEATRGTVLRRVAERTRDIADCDAALATLREAETDQNASNADLSWALQRRSLAAVFLLKHRLSPDSALLRSGLAAVQDAIDNYQTNPHNFWIRPSAQADADETRAQIESELQRHS